MRVAAFVILCCALQYITSEIIDDKIHNILNDKNKYETKNETTSDEYEIDPNTGKVVEKLTTRKEFVSKNRCSSDLNKGDVKIFEFVMTKDDQGRDRIYEKDTIIKKVPETSVNDNSGILVISTSSSSASAASEAPQSNFSVTTGSAASASTAASSNAGIQGPASGSTSPASSSGQRSGASDPESISGTQGSSEGSEDDGTYGISLAAASAATSGAGSTSSTSSATGTQGPASGYASAASSSNTRSDPGDPGSICDTQGLSKGSEVGGPYENASGRDGVYGPGSGSSGSPLYSKTMKGVKTGKQRPENGPVLKLADTAPGKRRTNDNKGSLATSLAATSAATTRARATSSALSAAGTQGPASGYASAASSSNTRSDPGDPGSIFDTQGLSEGSEVGGPYENASERDGVYGPGSGSSGSPLYSKTIKGVKTGKQRPENGPVLKLADTAPGKRRTNDNKGSLATSLAATSAATTGAGSTSSASSAVVTQGPASGYTSAASSSDTRSDPVDPRSIFDTQGLSEGSEVGGPYENESGRDGVYGPGSGSSDSPLYSKGVKTGKQRPENGPVLKLADTAPGKRQTNDNKGSLATSLAATSAATTGAGSTSSASSAVVTQGPASGYTSAASSSDTRSDAVNLDNISGRQVSSGGSEEGKAYGNGSGQGGVNQLYGNQRLKLIHIHKTNRHGSSGSPGGLTTEKADQTGAQRPENGPVLKRAGIALGKRPPGLDFHGAGYDGEYDFPPQLSITTTKASSLATSLAATNAATTRARATSSALSAVGIQGPASGYASAASSSNTRSDPGDPGSIFDTQGLSEGSEVGGPYENASERDGVYGPGSGSSGSPLYSKTIKGVKTGKQRPENGPVLKLADTAPGKRRTNDNKGSLATSLAATSAATTGAGSTSSASSAVVTQGPASGYTSAASSSDTRSDPVDPRSIFDTQGLSEGSEVGGPYENESGRDGVYGPGSGSSDSPLYSKGVKTGKQRPENGPVLKLADTAPGKRQTNDNKGSLATSLAATSAATTGAGSTSSASSAVVTQGPASGYTSAASSSDTRSDAVNLDNISGRQVSSGGSEEGKAYGNGSGQGGVNQLYGNQRLKLIHIHKTNRHGSSGSPGGSTTEKADQTGAQRPENGPVLKRAGIALGKRPPGLDFHGAGYDGEYDFPPQLSITTTKASSLATSLAATNAATTRARATSSALSAVGIQGPASGYASAASSSNTRSDPGDPGSIFDTQGLSEGSEVGGPYENASGRDDVYGPGSGSSGSPLYSKTIKGVKTGKQRPENRPVLKRAGTALGKRPLGLDFHGAGYDGEYDFPPQLSITTTKATSLATSLAATSAATSGAGSTSSASSAVVTQGPASGYTSAALCSDTRSDPVDPGSIFDTQGLSEGSEVGGPYENASGRDGVYGPGSGSSDSPLYSKGVKTGKQRPENGPVLKLADTAPRKRQTNDNKGSLATSLAATSAATTGAGSTSSASSAVVTQGPASGYTSAASSSDTRSDAVNLDNISGRQVSSGGSEEGKAYGNGSGQGGVNQLYGNQRLKLIHIHKTNRHGSSGSPGGSTTEKADQTGAQRPENGPVLKRAGTALGKRPPGLDFHGAGYDGEYDFPPQLSITTTKASSLATSLAATNAATTRARATSSALSAAGIQGPASGYASAASSSNTRSDPGDPGSIFDTQGLSEGSEVGGPYENASGRDDVYGPGSGSSGSPLYSKTIKGVKTGKQRPENRPVLKRAGTALGKRSPGLDFHGAGYDGEYDFPPQLSITTTKATSLATSLAATSAATSGAGSTSSASSAVVTQGPASGYTSAASSSDTRSDPVDPGSIFDTQGLSEGSEVGGPHENAYERDGVYGPGSSSSGSPLYSKTIKGVKTGKQRPENRPVLKRAGTALGKRPPGLDFHGAGYDGEYDFPPQLSITTTKATSLATSLAATSAATTRARATSSALSAAGTRGPASGYASAASSSNTRSDPGDPGSIFDTQGLSEGSEVGGPYENASGRDGVYGPGSGSSDSPLYSKGVKTGKQRPENGPVLKLADTAPGKRRTNDNKGSLATSLTATSAATTGAGSTSSASSAVVTQGPASGYTSAASSNDTRSDAVNLDNISGRQVSSGGSEEGKAYRNGSGQGGVNQLYGNQRRKLIHIHKTNRHGSSGSPGGSTTEKADQTGAQRPENGPVLKRAGIALGKRPPGLDFHGAGYDGEYDFPPQLSITTTKASSLATSLAATNAATTRARATSSALSAAGIQGPASGYASAASSSNTRSDPGDPGSIFDTQGLSEGSEVGGPYENASGRDGVYGPGSGSSGSPLYSKTIKGVKTGKQRPENRPVLKRAGTAPGKRPPGLDFHGAGYDGEYDFPPQLSITTTKATSLATSLAATSAATTRARATSSALSAAGTQGPASGYASAASSSNTRSDPGDPGSIFDTQGLSEGSEVGGPYKNASGRDGVYGPESGSSGSPLYSKTIKGVKTGKQRPENGPVLKLADTAPGNRRTNDNKGSLATSSAATSAATTGAGSTSSPWGPTSKPIDSITGNNQNELGPDSNGPGYYGQDYVAPQELLIIEDNAGGSATDTNRPESGSQGKPGASPTTKEGVSGTQRPGSGPASKPVDNIIGNNQNKIRPDFYGPGFYGQDYSAPHQLPTIKDNGRGSESSSSPATRAPAEESAAGILDEVPARGGVASLQNLVTSVQGRKRVRPPCRLRSSQFVLRLGRKGQPCTFCY